MWSEFGFECRWSLRRLWCSWRRTVSVVGVLGVTLGFVATAMTVLYSVLIRALPYANSDDLVTVSMNQTVTRPGGDLVSLQQYDEWREHSTTVESTGIYRTGIACVLGPAAQRLQGVSLSSSVAGLVFPAPLAGRLLDIADDAAGAAPVAIVSDRVRRATLASMGDVVGAYLDCRVPGAEVTERVRIVGVVPGEFTFPMGTDSEVWMSVRRATADVAARTTKAYNLVGRLRHDASLATASDEFRRSPSTVAGTVTPNGPLTVVRLVDAVPGTISAGLWLVLGGAVLVYALACASAATLWATRSRAEHAEMGIRVALGASRRQLMMRYLTDASLVSVIAGGLSAGIATAGLGLVDVVARGIVPRTQELGIGLPLLFSVCALAVLTPVLIGTIPAIAALRFSPKAVLAGRGDGAPRRALLPPSQVLVAVQVWLAVLLVAATIQLASGFRRLVDVDLGFVPAGLVAVQVRPPYFEWTAGARSRWSAFYAQLIDELAAARGVQAVAAVDALPLDATSKTWTFGVEGSDAREGDPEPSVERRVVAGDYFRTMGMTLRSGRSFARTDTASTERVAVVNDACAEAYWPRQSPLDRSLAFGRDRYRVVGIVNTVRHFGPFEPGRPEVYLWQAQVPTPSMTIVARVSGPARPEQIIRDAVKRSAYFEMGGVEDVQRKLGRYWALPRLLTVVATVFGAVAFLVAVAGVFLLQYHLTQLRMREFGIRAAVGAAPPQLTRLAVRGALAPVFVGVGAGLVTMPLCSRALSAAVGPLPLEPWSATIMAVGCLTVACLAASYLPARRAGKAETSLLLRVG